MHYDNIEVTIHIGGSPNADRMIVSSDELLYAAIMLQVNMVATLLRLNEQWPHLRDQYEAGIYRHLFQIAMLSEGLHQDLLRIQMQHSRDDTAHAAWIIDSLSKAML